jgi:FdhD protein
MPAQEDIRNLMETAGALCGSGGRVVERTEEVCVERVIRLFLNNEPIGNLVASPAQLRELGAGFVISEGIARSVETVDVCGDEVKVFSRDIETPRVTFMGSSGGISTGKIMRKVVSRFVMEREDISRVISEIVSELWEKTGGAHCSVLFSGRDLVAKSSDVGRHNTVDKVIGYAVLNGIDLSLCVLGCTGRQPAGMVSKAVNAGIPAIISKAATTDEGIRLARDAGLTLVCRVKEGRFCVYTHPHRIRGLAEDDLKTS